MPSTTPTGKTTRKSGGASARRSQSPQAFKGEAARHERGNRARAAGTAAPRKATGPDAITFLRADHKAVTELFEKFDKMKGHGPTKKALVERICNELTVHTQIEEEIFYPAARAHLRSEDLVDEAVVEHMGAKRLIAELRRMSPGDDLYDAKVTVLSEYIKHHVKEEQTDLFPKVKATRLDMKEIGAQLAARKQALMARI